MKSFRKKGFTLVEIIVVMLIISILATMFIPNMMGYIKRTEETTAIMECRGAVIAAQTILNYTYAYSSYECDVAGYHIKTNSCDTENGTALNMSNYNGITQNLNGVICGLAEVSGEVTNISTDSNCKLMSLTYISEKGVEVMYDSLCDTSYLIMNK